MWKTLLSTSLSAWLSAVIFSEACISLTRKCDQEFTQLNFVLSGFLSTWGVALFSVFRVTSDAEVWRDTLWHLFDIGIHLIYLRSLTKLMLNILFCQGKGCSYKFLEGAGRADSNFNGLFCFAVMPTLLDMSYFPLFFFNPLNVLNFTFCSRKWSLKSMKSVFRLHNGWASLTRPSSETQGQLVGTERRNHGQIRNQREYTSWPTCQLSLVPICLWFLRPILTNFRWVRLK